MIVCCGNFFRLGTTRAWNSCMQALGRFKDCLCLIFLGEKREPKTGRGFFYDNNLAVEKLLWFLGRRFTPARSWKWEGFKLRLFFSKSRKYQVSYLYTVFWFPCEFSALNDDDVQITHNVEHPFCVMDKKGPIQGSRIRTKYLHIFWSWLLPRVSVRRLLRRKLCFPCPARPIPSQSFALATSAAALSETELSILVCFQSERTRESR